MIAPNPNLRFSGLFCVMFLMMISIPVSDVIAKEFHIRQIDIVAEIQADGSVHVSETRTFYFDGSFSWYQQEINKRGFSSIDNITISENGRPLQFSDSNDEGTYSVRDRRNTVEIRTNFSVKNDERRFTLSYELRDAIASNGDWAEFNWAFIGSGWDRPHENISITVRLPEEVRGDELHAWQTSRARNHALSSTNREINYTAENLRSGRNLRIQTIFPVRVMQSTVPTDAVIDPIIIQERIDAELLAEAEREVLREQRAGWMVPLGYFFILLSLLFTVYMVMRFGRKAQLGNQISAIAERPPSVMEPALIGWLFRYKFSAHQHRFTASIFDMARKGYFSLSQEKGETAVLKKEKDVFMLERTEKAISGDLKPWEVSLIKMLEERLGGEKKSFEDVFKSRSTYKESSEFSKWWNSWFTEIGKEARSMDLYVDNVKPMAALIVVQLMFLTIALGLGIYIGGINAAPAIGLLIVSLAGAFSAFMLNVRTEKGELLYQQWMAYYNALKDGRVSLAEDLKGLHIIYGVLFGLSGKRMTNLISSMQLEGSDLTWMYFIPGTMPNAALFGQAVNSMVQSAGTSISTGTSGAVGGAAGGGGGGSAG